MSLWHVEGYNWLRHKVGDYFRATTAAEAKQLFANRFEGVPTRCVWVR